MTKEQKEILRILGSSFKDRHQFEKIGDCVLKKQNGFAAKEFTMGLFFLTPAKMADLNWRALRHKRPTTVISLPAGFYIKKEKLYLGDIYICKEEAAKNDYSIEYLFLHGLLHLLGFDHTEDESAWQQAEKNTSFCLNNR